MVWTCLIWVILSFGFCWHFRFPAGCLHPTVQAGTVPRFPYPCRKTRKMWSSRTSPWLCPLICCHQSSDVKWAITKTNIFCTIGPSLSSLVSPCARAVGVLVSIELKAQKYLASTISNVMVIDGVVLLFFRRFEDQTLPTCSWYTHVHISISIHMIICIYLYTRRVN